MGRVQLLLIIAGAVSCPLWEVELSVRRSLDCSASENSAKPFPEKLLPKDSSRSNSLFRAWLFRAYQDFAESFLVRYPQLAEFRFPAAVSQCQQVESRCSREALQFQRGASRCCLEALPCLLGVSRYFLGALRLRLER